MQTFITRIDTLTGFDRWGPDANPLIQQVKRQPTRLTVRRSVWIAFGIGLAGLILSTWQVLRTSSDMLIATDVLFFMTGWLFYGLVPIVVAFSAVLQTRRITRPERFDALYVTILPNGAIIWALVFGALYRMRYTLITLVALFPALIVRTFHMLVLLDLWFRQRYNNYLLAPPTYAGIVIPTLLMIVVALSLWGMTLLGAAAGVRTGLLRQNAEASVIIAPLVVLLTMSAPCICLMTAPISLDAAPPWCGALLAIAIPLGIVVVPYALAVNTMWMTAHRWQR